jgi:hypothetical protein
MTMRRMYLLEVPKHTIFARKHHLAAHYWARPCGLVDHGVGVLVVCLLVLACVE